MTKFVEKESWLGGWYEIEIELARSSNERLELALRTVWSHQSLDGCYLNRDQEPGLQARVSPPYPATEGHLYEMARLPNGATTVCGTFVCRFESDGPSASRDLLALYFPLGSLSKAYPIGGYPFSDAKDAAPWRVELDHWLVNIGEFVYQRAAFSLALVGFEVDFPNVSSEVIGRTGIPKVRYDGYLWPGARGLQWYAPTDFETVKFSQDSSGGGRVNEK